MFNAILNGLRTGASGAATSGAFGAGAGNFLGGHGTALGSGAVKEFGTMPQVGAMASNGLGDVLSKLQNMTPEQSLMIAQQMAQFSAPPLFGTPEPVRPAVSQYSNFMNPGAGAQAPVMRTPLMPGGQ